MSDPVIELEGVSKKYVIGHQRQNKDDGLRHALQRAATAPLRWMRSGGRIKSSTDEEFWALRDVTFNVNPGEVVGIIGRNGAGKSTLLKILSRITELSEGRARLRGRVSSLLEVGTGFHPELTGRENIYLNGAILGMARVEIKRKFDEIVAFAEIEKFLDTPVKRYSSGMYVRLAFAVAAHLEPEILIVDEVLAVGDADFQKKCLDKMDSVGDEGRTVLFVSHNMQAVTRLCSRCVLLEDGEVRLDGPSSQVASEYLSAGIGTSAERTWTNPVDAPGDELLRFSAVRVLTETGETCETSDIRNSVAIQLEYEVLQSGHVVHPHFALTNEDGVVLFVAQDLDDSWRGKQRPPGRYRSTGRIPGNLLAEGAFTVSAFLRSLNQNTLHASARDAVHFRVIDPLTASDTARGDYPMRIPGAVRPMLEWTTEQVRSEQPAGIGKS